jgi:hypothetical protein
MSEHKELIEEARDASDQEMDTGTTKTARLLDRLIDALETATKPSTVSTVAELWKLPIGTVIREAHGMILEYQNPFWAETGLDFGQEPHVDWLPATILFTPTDAGSES